MTEPKAVSLVDPEDLSIRARRGELSADQQRALEQALLSQPTLQVAHQVGRDFDQQLRVRPGDDEIVLRASSRALEQRRPRNQSRFALAAALAAAALIASAVAARVLYPSFQGAATSGDESRVQTRSAPRRAVAPARSASPREVAQAMPVAGPEFAPGGRGSPNAGSGATPPAIASAAKPLPSARGDVETAASLFREAGAARRAGDLSLARARYAELQAKFPNTNEARVSRVSLGKLLLSAGRAREAEREFSAYLAEGGTALGEEALVGRAEALARLGESGEERRVWQELLRDHGSSVYRERARQRLQALLPGGKSGSR